MSLHALAPYSRWPPAAKAIAEIATPEQAAQVFAENEQTFADIKVIWKHVTNLIEEAGREGRVLRVEGGIVAVEPLNYDYDITVAKELAPEAVKLKDITPVNYDRINTLAAEAMQAINEIEGQLNGEIDPDVARDLDKIREAMSEIGRLTQPILLEGVDGRTLNAVLAKGDTRSLDLIKAGVKVARSYKIVKHALPLEA